MLNSRNNVNGVFLNITIYLYNNINLGSKLLALLYNNGSSKERVSLRLLSLKSTYLSKALIARNLYKL